MQEGCISFIMIYEFSQIRKMIAGNLVKFKARSAKSWIVLLLKASTV